MYGNRVAVAAPTPPPEPDPEPVAGPGEDAGWPDDDASAAARRLFELHNPSRASIDAATVTLLADPARPSVT